MSEEDFVELILAQSGTTFKVAGPNCYATALHARGFYSTYRGVNEPEFHSYVDLFCERVESPQMGDVGVFKNPHNQDFVHAYLYLDQEFGFDKPGVDYMGVTPVKVRPLFTIYDNAISSPECKQYAPDPSVCSNEHYYVRCKMADLGSSPWSIQHQADVLALENKMSQFILRQEFSKQQLIDIKDMEADLYKLNESFKNQKVISGKLRGYLENRLASLEDQLEFFRIRMSKFKN